MTCGRDVSLWVGGLDAIANFVPKIDIAGLVRIALLGGRLTPVFEDHLSVHLMRAEISLARWFALQTYWGSAWSFHTCFVVLLAPRLGSIKPPLSLFSESRGYIFLFILIQIDTGRAGPWIIGIYSFPFSGVAAACFKYALPVVGTVADVTDVHVFKRWR